MSSSFLFLVIYMSSGTNSGTKQGLCVLNRHTVLAQDKFSTRIARLINESSDMTSSRHANSLTMCLFNHWQNTACNYTLF